MKTRAPAWCDRILMNKTAWTNIFGNSSPASGSTEKIIYKSIGADVCTGDHKVWFFFLSLKRFITKKFFSQWCLRFCLMIDFFILYWFYNLNFLFFIVCFVHMPAGIKKVLSKRLLFQIFLYLFFFVYFWLYWLFTLFCLSFI